MVDKNRVRLDHKPIFWSSKQQITIPPSQIDIEEIVDKHHFVEFEVKQEDLRNMSPQQKTKVISQLHAGLRFVVQVDQPWKLCGVQVS